MTGMQIQQATQGRWLGPMPAAISHLCTDTRKIGNGDAFLALRGPHFDGHEFGSMAANRGASALIGDAEGVAGWQDIELPQLKVGDGLQALGDIAAAWRNRIDTKIVAITGSVGKTTLRSMLEHALKGLGLKIAATHANENNLIGVPQTLLNISGNENIALIECGISETGEMARLADIVQPNIAVITAVTHAHTAGLGGIAGVLHEKTALLKTLRPHGWCVLGSGVASLAREHGYELSHPVLDMDKEDDGVVRWQLSGTRLQLQLGNQQVGMELALPASHWAANMALAASIICRLADSTLSQVAEALGDWQPVGGRMQLLPGPAGSRLIDDTYNANPASMQAALDTLHHLPGRHFAVLGDMAELGDGAEQAHAALDIAGLDGVILIGNHMRLLQDTQAKAAWAPDASSAAQLCRDWQLTAGDHVLLKGSRSTGLDAVVRSLMEESDAV